MTRRRRKKRQEEEKRRTGLKRTRKARHRSSVAFGSLNQLKLAPSWQPIIVDVYLCFCFFFKRLPHLLA